MIKFRPCLTKWLGGILSDVSNTHLRMSHLGDVSISLIETVPKPTGFVMSRVKVLFKNSKTTLLRRYSLFKLLFQALNIDIGSDHFTVLFCNFCEISRIFHLPNLFIMYTCSFYFIHISVRVF